MILNFEKSVRLVGRDTNVEEYQKFWQKSKITVYRTNLCPKISVNLKPSYLSNLKLSYVYKQYINKSFFIKLYCAVFDQSYCSLA